MTATFFRAILSRISAGRRPAERAADVRNGHLANRHLVLDGTNIALLHGPANPELRYVLALAHFLSDNGGKVSCFFDANTPYLFSDTRSEQRSCFNRLTTEQPWAPFFTVVPSGTQADQWILELARQNGADVISNDRFRDRAKAHRWIWKRRHGLKVSAGCLILSDLNGDTERAPPKSLSIELLSQPEDYLPALFQSLSRRSP